MRLADTARYREQVLGVLKEAEGALSVSQIAETKKVKASDVEIRRALNWLAGERQVIKIPARGSGFKYKYLSPVEDTAVKLTEKRDISPVGFAQLLRSLADKKWTPKTTKSSSAVPYAVTKLYHFAHDIAMGGKRTQDEYDDVRVELRAYHDDLLNSLATVRGILDKSELWSAKDSAKWLLSAGGSSADYDFLANEAERKQR